MNIKRKIIGIFICTLLIGTIIPVGINATEIYNPLDGGWVEEIDGVTILHVSGTHYEMGYQHGYLLKDKIEQNYRAVIDSADPELYNYVLEYWNAFWKYYTTEEYIDEMRGLSDGSGKSFDDVAAFNLWLLFLLMEDRGCMNMAAWGPATADGKLYHMSSVDIPPTVKDPETRVYLHENQILMVREPDNCYASITTVVAGCHTICGGMNEKSISLGSEGSPSYDCSDCSGNEYVSQLQVLDHASSAAEAIAIKKVNRNGPWNLIICDGKIPTALVIESTANLWSVSTWDSPIESISPFWSIDHVVRRKNMFIHPLTANTQRERYDPRTYLVRGMLPGVIPWFNPWRYYKTLSEETEKIWGTINLDNTMNMMRSIYCGETDLYLFLSWKMGWEPFAAYYQWVFCPETGDMIVSFAHGENFAQYEDVHHFNLFELLNSEPP